MTGRRKFGFDVLMTGSQARRRSQESGYAYIMALFMILAVIIASQVALQNLATQSRRLREEQMIWRGEQCERAIKLYYRKTGHYPQTFEDLQKGLPDLHFLRAAAYKDPINKTDGSWRMIYVNASGQIIGSVRYATLQQMALMDLNGGKIPEQAVLPGAVAASSMASEASKASETDQKSEMSGQPTPPAQAAKPPDQAPASPLQAPTPPEQGPTPMAQLKPTGPVEGPVLGAFLTGVAGKADRPSVRVYKGGTKYIEWEFIWNPVEDQVRAVQQGLAPQGALPGQPGKPIIPGGIGTAPTFGAPGFGGSIVQPTTPAPAPQE
jgi:type II secretory pathway pseudopilin PulG